MGVESGERRAKPSAISTAWLRRLPALHLPPIEQVIYLRPYQVGPVGGLILGRASRLDAFSAYPIRTSATRRRAWQPDRHTVGPSTPVLSY